MALRGVEGRVANIVRWLERFERAYSSGAIESALMDAECAKADLDDLRNDVWSRVGSKCGRERRRGRAPVMAFSLAAAAVILTATPVSIKADSVLEYAHLYADAVDSDRASAESSALLSMLSSESVPRPVVAEVREPAVTPRGVTASSPSSDIASSGVPAAQRAAVKMTQSASEKMTQPVRKSARRGSATPRSGIPAENAENYGKILSLFQTGSRALGNDKPVISVNRTKGEKNI